MTRLKYVYIKALISSLNGLPISTEERLDFKQRFENGIRFWNREDVQHDFAINYNADNYESYLDQLPPAPEPEPEEENGGQLT